MSNFPDRLSSPMQIRLRQPSAQGDLHFVEGQKSSLLVALAESVWKNELDWQVVSALNKIAHYYETIKDYEVAAQIQTKILDAQKAVLRSGCPEIIDTAMKICNLAMAKSHFGDKFEKADVSTAA